MTEEIFNMILSSQDPRWNPDETLGQFEDRCIETMSLPNRTDHVELMVLHSGGSAESACQSIIDYKYNGLFGSNYFDYRRIIILLIYGSVMVAGCVANISVGWVLLFNSQARTARNLFILNLAFSDILVCLVTIPLTALRMYNAPSWNLGVDACRLIGLLEGTNLLVSSGTASAIAGDRLCLVTRKTARRNDTKPSTIGLILGAIWFISLLTCIPTVFYTNTYNFYLPTTDLLLYQVCTEKWSAPMHRFLYTLLLMFVQYVIPIGTILVTHTKIIRIVKMRTERATQMGRLSLPHAQANGNGALAGKNAKKQHAGKRAMVTMNRNKKTTQILLIIAGTFAVCWFPYHLFMILSELDAMFDLQLSVVNPQGINYIFIGCHVIAMTTTITNPILYGWLNTNLKHLFRAMIPYLKQDRDGLTTGGSSLGPVSADHHPHHHQPNGHSPHSPPAGGANEPLLHPAKSAAICRLGASQSDGSTPHAVAMTVSVSRRSLPTEMAANELTTVIVGITDEEDDTVTSDGKAEYDAKACEDEHCELLNGRDDGDDDGASDDVNGEDQNSLPEDEQKTPPEEEEV